MNTETVQAPQAPQDTHDARVEEDARVKRVVLDPRGHTAWHRIRVTFTGEEAIVTGDAYDWVFKWHGAKNIVEEIPRFGEHYIRGKLVAASTQAQPMVYDRQGTVENLDTYYGESQEWPEIKDAAMQAYDQNDAIEAIAAEVGEPSEVYDLVALKPSAQLSVAIRAVQMAADQLCKARDVRADRIFQDGEVARRVKEGDVR